MIKINFSELLSKRILQLCEERKWSVNLVATISGLAPSTLNKIVSMQIENPTVSTLHAIAVAFDMTLSEFLDTEDFNKLSKQYRK